jgi:hypothetical protein
MLSEEPILAQMIKQFCAYRLVEPETEGSVGRIMAARSLLNRKRLINRISVLEAFSRGRLPKLYRAPFLTN